MGRKLKVGCAGLMLIVISAVLGASLWYNRANRESIEAEPLDGASTETAYFFEKYEPRPVSGEAEEYRHLAPNGNATMHADAAQSDVHQFAAPMGTELEVRSRRAGGRMPRQCANTTFRSDGLLVLMCGGLGGFRLTLLDPNSLAALATHDLGIRSSALRSMITQDLSHTFSDSSGGAYFVLDAQDRVIVGDPRQHINVISARKGEDGWAFIVDEQWDLSDEVPSDCLSFTNWFPAEGQCDGITTVMPGPDGYYWWTTRGGLIGTLDPATGRVTKIRMDGEQIQNALAADDDAIYVLTDHAQYALVSYNAGTPRVLWRHAYDRGTSRKLGSINQGSGTTPTLLGQRYITFTDNADGRVNLIVLHRGPLSQDARREICKVPLFSNGASAAENSMIGWGRSIVIENNWGYTNAAEHEDWAGVAGGVTRIDIRPDDSGCDIVWRSAVVVPSVVPKLSQPTGIAYFYSFDLSPEGSPQWYIAGLDWQTGRLVQRIATGGGSVWDNNWSAFGIGPDGSLYLGTSRGLLQVRQMTGAQGRQRP